MLLCVITFFGLILYWFLKHVEQAELDLISACKYATEVSSEETLFIKSTT